MYQMYRRDEVIAALIRRYISTSDHEVAAVSDVWDLFRILCQSDQGFTFVVDGFDECLQSEPGATAYDDVSRESSLKKIRESLSDTNNHLLVISRDEVDIRRATFPADDPGVGTAILEHAISIKDTKADVGRYSLSLVNRKLASKPDALKTDLAEGMANSSQGMFLWVRMQENQLRSHKNAKQLRQAVKDMPLGLEKAFVRDWDRIMTLDAEDRERALALLRWLVFCTRELTVFEVTEVLLVTDDDECNGLAIDDFPDYIDEEYIREDIFRLGGSLIEVRPDSNALEPGHRKLGLVHFTVRSFLLSKFDCGTAGFDQRTKDNRLAGICVRYLGFKETWQTLDTPNAELNLHPFRTYAATSWYSHIDSEGPGFNDLMRLLKDFFMPGNPCWLSWRILYEDSSIVNGASRTDALQPLPGSTTYYASRLGLLPLVQFTQARSAGELSVVGGTYGTPLQAACVDGHAKVVIYLLQQGVDVNARAGHFGSALGAACRSGSTPIVAALLAADADVELTDIEENISPLYPASRNGYLPIVKMLLDAGANAGAPIKNGTTPLSAAANNGRLDVVKLLLASGADVDYRSDGGWTPAVFAANNGHAETLQELLNNGADACSSSMNGWTPITCAADGGHVEAVRVLLEAGARIDASAAIVNGWSALVVAASRGFEAVAKKLLDHGADVNHRTENSGTALIIASQNGHYETARLLVTHGADVMIQFKSTGWTALHAASFNGHLKVAELLLNSGADINHVTTLPQNALACATIRHHSEIVRLLAEHPRVEVDITTHNDMTPLMTACHEQMINIVRILLEKGASVRAKMKTGLTPLMIAASRGFLDVVEMILEKDDQINAIDDYGATAINKAAYGGHATIVNLLISKGADIRMLTNAGFSPLCSAASQGHLDCVRALLTKDKLSGFDPSDRISPLSLAALHNNHKLLRLLLDHGHSPRHKNSAGGNPLHAAGEQGTAATAQLLLDHGVDIDAKASGGETALYWTAIRGNVEVSKLLIQNGANLDIANNGGWTPLNAAISTKHFEAAALLLNYGTNADIANRDNETVLHTAVKTHEVAYVKLIFDKARTNRSDTIGAGSDSNAHEHQYGVEVVCSSTNRTPLHQACFMKFPEAVKMLVELGAKVDPLSLDICGRSCLDWASLSQACYTATGMNIQDYKPTSRNRSEPKLRAFLSKSMQRSLSRTPGDPEYQSIGKALLWLGDVVSAAEAFEFKMSETEGQVTHEATCDFCTAGKHIRDIRYVCSVCPDADLCASCYQKFQRRELCLKCTGHEYLKVPRDDWPGLVSKPDTRKTATQNWLLNLQARFPGQ